MHLEISEKEKEALKKWGMDCFWSHKCKRCGLLDACKSVKEKLGIKGVTE